MCVYACVCRKTQSTSHTLTKTNRGAEIDRGTLQIPVGKLNSKMSLFSQLSFFRGTQKISFDEYPDRSFQYNKKVNGDIGTEGSKMTKKAP